MQLSVSKWLLDFRVSARSGITREKNRELETTKNKQRGRK